MFRRTLNSRSASSHIGAAEARGEYVLIVRAFVPPGSIVNVLWHYQEVADRRERGNCEDI